MLRAYNQLMRAEFQQQLAQRIPGFAQVSTDFDGVIYRRGLGGGYLFICLQPAPQNNRFTIELAYSVSAEYPFHILPGNAGKDGERRLRVSSVLGEKTERWWNVDDGHLASWDAVTRSQTVDPERLAAVPCLVQEAIAALEVGIPRFQVLVQSNARSRHLSD
jgi:hypothetical protein